MKTYLNKTHTFIIAEVKCFMLVVDVWYRKKDVQRQRVAGSPGVCSATGWLMSLVPVDKVSLSCQWCC